MAEIEKSGRRTRSDYEKLFVEQASSGLSLRAFAESRGINPSTLYGWHRRLRPSAAKKTKKKPELVAVQVVEETEEPTPARHPTRAPSFEITIPGERVVSVHVGFDAQELRRLLTVLGSGC